MGTSVADWIADLGIFFMDIGRVPNFQQLIWSVDRCTKENLWPSTGTIGIGGQNDGLGSAGVRTRVRFWPKFKGLKNRQKWYQSIEEVLIHLPSKFEEVHQRSGIAIIDQPESIAKKLRFPAFLDQPVLAH